MDPINPDYYVKGNLESIRVIETFVPDKPYRWAPLKYLFRAGKKPGQDEVQDLRKAIWWIEREIATIEAAEYVSDFELPPVPAPDMDCIGRVVGRDLNNHPDRAMVNNPFGRDDYDR